jgi:hypothetical protein
MNITYYSFLKKLTQLFFKNSTQVISIAQSVDLFDTLYVDKYLGKSLPSTLTQNDYLNLQHLNSWYYILIPYTINTFDI